MEVMNLVIEKVENGFIVTAATARRPYIFLAATDKEVLHKVKETLPMLSTPTAEPPPPPLPDQDENSLPEFSDDDL